jgi:hypothetical protein
MRSLFMAATGGEDWSRFHGTLKQAGAMYDYLFLFFMAFTIIAFFNVITGVFAEKAMSLASPTMAELTCRRRDAEVKNAEELMAVLRRILKKQDGTHPSRATLLKSDQGISSISIHAFDDLMSHPEVEAFFEVRGLKATTAHRFFMQMLEINQTDHIDIGAFVSACVKLDGNASSIDLHVISVEMKTVLLRQNMMKDTMDKSYKQIADVVAKQLSLFRNEATTSPVLTPQRSAVTTPTLMPVTHMATITAGPECMKTNKLPFLLGGPLPPGNNVPEEFHEDDEGSPGSPTRYAYDEVANMAKTANDKLVRATGDECAVLSSCCKGVEDAEETSLPSTKAGSTESCGMNDSVQLQGGAESLTHFVL